MVKTTPRRRIELDSADMVWRVEEGAASIMIEPAPGSDLPRASETLYSVEKGGYAFGVSSEGHPNIKIFLETTPGAKLVPMLAADFVSQCAMNPYGGAKLLNNAVEQLARHVSPAIPPADVKKMVRPGGNFHLPKKIRVSALSETWFRMDKGTAHYGGARAVGEISCNIFRPLLGNMWVELSSSDRLICVDTVDLVRAGQFYEPFVSFVNMAILMVYEKFSEMALSNFMQLMESTRHKEQEFQKSLGLAAAVIDPRLAGENGQPNLTQTMKLLGKALHCTIEEPPRLKKTLEAQLEDFLDHNGLYSREVTLSGRWFEQDSGPLLGFIHNPTGPAVPTALLPSKKGYSYLSPQTGKKERVTAKEAASFSVRALQLYPSLPSEGMTPLKLTKYSLRGCGKEIALMVLMGVLGGVAGFGIPMAMSTTVDTVISNGEYGMLWQVLFGLIMVVFGGGVFEMTKNAATLRIETRVQISLQSAMFSKLLKLPVDFFKQYSAGDLSNRVMAVDNIRQILSGSMLISLLSTVFAMTNLVLLAVYSWQLSLAVLVIVLVTLVFIALLMQRQVKAQSQVQDVMGKLAGQELQFITGINKLRAAGAETNAFAQWMTKFTELRKVSYAIGKGTNLVTVYSSGLPLFTSLVVFGLFIVTGLHKELSLGSFLCFNAAMGQLMAAVATLASTSVSLLFIKPMYERTRPILEARPESHAALEDPGRLLGAVETMNVSFSYPGASQPALRQVSIKAAPGDFIAIVGPSGSGKSTLFKLLLGFHQPASGVVLFDDKPLRRLDPVKVRRQVGSVIQNGELIQGNVFFNIVGANKDATEEDAWEAARLAAVDEDIRQMPMGMNTFVPHGGSTFSGGQKQRLLMARALSKKPNIFLLDEATSNLDNTSQTKVMNNLRRINATRIVVAHRLSTIKDADRIYVMHQGRVAESGKFAQLMEKGGLFSRLASRQMD